MMQAVNGKMDYRMGMEGLCIKMAVPTPDISKKEFRMVKVGLLALRAGTIKEI